MIDYESQTTFWLMASLIFYAPIIPPHPPHSLDYLLTVPHLHFNRGGSQTLIPSPTMSINSFFTLPHAPQPTEKSRERGIPPLLLPHLPHLSVCLSEIDSPGKGAPIHLLWHSLVWQRRNLPPLLPEMLSIPFYRCHIITLSSCPPISFPSILDVWGPVLSWPQCYSTLWTWWNPPQSHICPSKACNSTLPPYFC